MNVEANIEIRPATSKDLEAVVLLAMELFRELAHQVPEADLRATAHRLLHDRTGFFALVAFKGGHAVGLATVSEDTAIYAGGTYGHLQELYVLRDERSAGVGRLLLQALRHIGESRKWSRVEVTAANDALRRAASFYLSNGFEETGPRLKLPLR